MREILFRGKRLDNGEWVEGFPIFYRAGQVGIAQIHIGTRIIPVEENEYWTIKDLFCPKVHPETVGQHTGLTDRNGVKIFEGDILGFVNHYQNAERTWKCVVEYGNNAAAFVCVYIDRYDDERIYNHFDSWNVPLVEWEVIGNRWDNPELLKEAEK